MKKYFQSFQVQLAICFGKSVINIMSKHSQIFTQADVVVY